MSETLSFNIRLFEKCDVCGRVTLHGDFLCEHCLVWFLCVVSGGSHVD